MEEMKTQEINTQQELLEQLLTESKKKTLYTKITAAASAGLFAAALIFLIFTLPKLSKAAENVNQVATQAQEIMSEGNRALLQIENAASEFTQLVEGLSETQESVNRFVTENSAALSDTVKQLNGIDYQTLNQAIRDLKDAVEPFAKLVNRFK